MTKSKQHLAQMLKTTHTTTTGKGKKTCKRVTQLAARIAATTAAKNKRQTKQAYQLEMLHPKPTRKATS